MMSGRDRASRDVEVQEIEDVWLSRPQQVLGVRQRGNVKIHPRVLVAKLNG